MNSKYEWRIKSLAKGLDPDECVAELERIETIYGSLTPENILKESEDENAVLHSLFQWEDDLAAKAYRIQQARTILNNVEIKIVKDGSISTIPVYEVVTINNERRYQNIQVMDRSSVEQVRKATLKDLEAIQKKLKAYDDFDSTIQHIQDAMDSV
jgi:hypothetical protein